MDEKTIKDDPERYEIKALANAYVDSIWPQVEGFFHVLMHGDITDESSLQGSHKIIQIFKDWIENNGGWKDVQNANSKIREDTVRRLIILGAKIYIQDHNFDINCDNNIGVGGEDIKISRGNDKTVIEIKLSSNPKCKHGYETQLIRYAEAEHTDNMIFVLVDLGDKRRVEEIQNLHRMNLEAGIITPDLIVINAKPQISASKM